MDQSLSEIVGPWFWLAIGLVLLGLELLGAGGFLLSIGVSALITAGISGMTEQPWPVEFVIFGVLSVVTTYMYWKFVRPNNIETEDPMLNNKMARLVGHKTAILVPVKAGVGKVQIHDALWVVSCDTDLDSGVLVEVTGYEGATLNVKPI
ncbi:NfeD family protein [Teredinibacter purpureus]|jgi:Membrane protein implicated in regulation of membrane protease activity|uniref:NfeD family protein n=1 Tax=Teredinibacter purpureus TaxID=2731756 RepID=UPI0005F82DDB|nr:NfeD family protein [Teredinibacter purpureus]